MRQILPSGATGLSGLNDLGDLDLAGLYAFPEGTRTVRANMVMSADGAATVKGRSRGLSSDADRRLFALLRGLADVILVGAGTVRAEHYKPVRPREVWSELRAGRPATPPIAVVTRRLELDPDDPLFTTAPPDARTILLTSELAPAERRAEFGRRCDIVVIGEDRVDLAAAMDVLAGRGYQRISCEGGPHLLGDLTTADQLDELCLTVSPLLAGPGAMRISEAMGLTEDPTTREMRLAHVLEEDGFLYCRYATR